MEGSVSQAGDREGPTQSCRGPVVDVPVQTIGPAMLGRAVRRDRAWTEVVLPPVLGARRLVRREQLRLVLANYLLQLVWVVG